MNSYKVTILHLNAINKAFIRIVKSMETRLIGIYGNEKRTIIFKMAEPPQKRY